MNHARADISSVSLNSSFHSRLAVRMSCSNIFALIVKGAGNPIGSKSVAFFRKIRLAYTIASSGAFSLNVNASSVACYLTPSVLTHGSGSVSISTSNFWSHN